MASNTLQTDFFQEVADPIAVLSTDEYSFDPVVVIVTATLQTNIWTFTTTGVVGELPTYNPSLMTAVAKVYQNLPFPQFVLAGQGGASQSEYALFKKTTANTFHIWRSPVYNIGKDFDVMNISFNLVSDLEDGTSITPQLYFDNERSISTGTTINSNNFSNTNKLIELTPKDFSNTIHGKANFFLEFQFRGTDLAVIGLPIFIQLEKYDN